MRDPFESQWYTVNHELPAFTYIELAKGKHHKTLSFGPVRDGWMRGDGTPDPEPHEVTEVLLDVAEDGTILSIEILVPGKVTYDKRREESS